MIKRQVRGKLVPSTLSINIEEVGAGNNSVSNNHVGLYNKYIYEKFNATVFDNYVTFKNINTNFNICKYINISIKSKNYNLYDLLVTGDSVICLDDKHAVVILHVKLYNHINLEVCLVSGIQSEDPKQIISDLLNNKLETYEIDKYKMTYKTDSIITEESK